MGSQPKAFRQPTTIVIADVDRMGCQLLSSALSRCSYHLKILSSLTDARSTVESVKQNQPDVLLLSAALQDGSLAGFGVLREIRDACPRTRVVMLLGSCDPDLVIDAFRGGASGVFPRSESVEQLGKCIHSVHSGQVWASSRELQILLDALSKTAPLRIVSGLGVPLLTAREEQIVQLVVEGLTNREISQRLGLSEHTVKNYLFHIYEKLGISSRVELTLYAFSRTRPSLTQPGP